MACPTPGTGLDICPTREEIVPQLLALLPRGRAWGTHDGGPFPGSTAYSFWTAVADVWAWVNAAICALAPEFFCATQEVTHDTWMEEYGLPDGCDPYPDLCTKVAAIAGTRCEYYTAIAARAGWSVACVDTNDACGVQAGRMQAGCATLGSGLVAGILAISVSLSSSPAYVGGAPNSSEAASPAVALPLAGRFYAGGTLACANTGGLAPPFAGALQAGKQLACPPDITGLECLLTRIVGAHVLILFEILP